jgi:hypothetical protein
MFIIRKNLGVSLITMASPITEAIALFIGIIMLYHFLQQLKKA